MFRKPAQSFLKTVLVGLAFTVIAHAPSAMAVTTLCEGDCNILDAVDRGDGTAYNFALGVSGGDEDTVYKVKTRGNIYLVGPVNTAKARLRGETIVLSDASNLPDNARFRTRNLLDSFTPVSNPVAPEAIDFKTRLKTTKKNKVRIKSNGDIYIDITGIDLRNVKLRARGTIIVSDERLDSTTPVPEPTTALLMALGLAGLSMRRGHNG